MEEYNNRIEAIRLAVIELEKEGLETSEVLFESTGWLYEKYQVTEDKRYLRQAMKHIQVYLEEGNQYEEHSCVFDCILAELGLDKETVLMNMFCGGTVIKANKSQVRSMLGRWNPHIHSMSIKEVTDDIILKVKNGIEGTYYYYSGRTADKDNKTSVKDRYRLTISKEKAQFWDMRRNLYYTIRK